MRSARVLLRQHLQLYSAEESCGAYTRHSWNAKPLGAQSLSSGSHTKPFATAAAPEKPRKFARERKVYAGELHKLRVEWNQKRLEAQKQQQEALLKRQQKRLAARSQQQAESDEAKAEKLALQAQRRVARLEQQVIPCLTAGLACIKRSTATAQTAEHM